LGTKISVIGQGYVGLPIAVNAAEAGYTVGGFDIDGNKIKNLKYSPTRQTRRNR
jgi:UDP-N-acetyl-D-glucosamine dehydrogenase